MKKILVAPFLLLVLLLAFAGSVMAGGPVGGGPSFGVSLSGAAEPSGGDPNGTGRALISLNQADGMICVDASYNGIAVPITGAHIHRGPAGEDGPIVVGFIGGGGDLPPTGDNSFSGCTAVDSSLIQSIAENPAGYYFNIHNSEHRGGAIRGQLGW